MVMIKKILELPNWALLKPLNQDCLLMVQSRLRLGKKKKERENRRGKPKPNPKVQPRLGGGEKGMT